MYTIAQILKPESGCSWHEAVALVQEAAAALGPGSTIPAPGDLYLDPRGSIMFGSIGKTGEHPVAGLARLLKASLDGIEAPAQIRELAADNTGPTPKCATVEAFTSALAFYERPDRSSTLRALAARLAEGSSEAAAAEAELRKLRERLAVTAEKTDPEQTPRAQPHRRSSRRLLIAAGIALCVAAVAVMARPFGIATEASAPGQTLSAERQPDVHAGAAIRRAGAKAAAALKAAGQSMRLDSVARSEQGPGRHGIHADALGPRASRSGTPAAGAMMTTDSRFIDPFLVSPTGSSAVDRPSSAIRFGNPPAAVGAATRAASSDGALERHVIYSRADIVYSRADIEVDPPWLMRPQLPKEPGPDEHAGVFEMIVDETGDVAEVKLTSPEGRYQERMLVSAAKAWKFSPARLNGEPVSYRIRIPVNLPDPR